MKQASRAMLLCIRLDLLRLRRDLLLVDSASTPLSGDAEMTLHILGLLDGTEVTSGQDVEGIVLLVGLVVHNVEEDTDTERNDGDGSVVPHKVGVVGEGSESLSEGSREGSGKTLDTHDQRPHVFGGLGVGILESGDGREDLGNSNKDVNTGHSPDVDGRLVVRVVGFIVTGSLVHVVLEDGSPQHGHSTEKETSSDLLDGGKVDLVLAEERVDVQIED